MADFMEKHQGLMNMLKLLVGVIVIVAIVNALGIFKSATVAVEIEDEVFTITYEDETVIQFSKDDIQSAELVTAFTMGEAVETLSGEKYTVGTWENEDWGQYTLCIKQSVERYIVLTTTDGAVCVFNYESADTTESMCSALLAW
ncbi:MAG: hypothetical protein LUI39_08310 [Lachnospiraceae bacterium]|nr:hypothetical protein [Lachnospiraceae bacterium]